MINNKLKIAVLGLALGASTVMADVAGYEFNTSSLVGIEGGYSSLDYENGTSLSNEQYTAKVSHAGLKIGAETRDFRVFLSGRYFYDRDKAYDYIVAYGAELQYKFNVAEAINFYIGANGGMTSMKFRAEKETFSRTISDPYFGGDIGTNIHLTDSIDLELGARVMSVQAENTKDTKTYLIGNMVSGYASIIFKWDNQ